MSLETFSLNQKAVLWPAGAFDSHGRRTRGDAVEVDCRWENTEDEAVDPQGNVVAVVATADLDRDVDVGSVMWLGNLLDLPDPPTDLKRVVSFSKIPDVKGREYTRRVQLSRLSDTLPTAES